MIDSPGPTTTLTSSCPNSSNNSAAQDDWQISNLPADRVMPEIKTEEQPLRKAVAALAIPIVICVILGILVWWQLLSDFSQSM